MNKRHAVTLARAGVTAGRLRAILDAATFADDEPSTVNGNFTKRQVHGEWRRVLDVGSVDYFFALKVLREFAEDEESK